MIILQNVFFISSCVFLIACNQQKSDFDTYQNGKEVYEKNCVSCHNTSNTTTYSPTLLEMHLNDTKFMSRLQLIKADSNHYSFFKNIIEEDGKNLAFFIDNYKIVVPGNTSK